MDHVLRTCVYRIYTLAVLPGLAGCLLRPGKKRDRTLALCLLATVVITLGISIYASYYIDNQLQGRYIISALPALALFMTCGYERLCAGVGKVSAHLRIGKRGCGVLSEISEIAVLLAFVALDLIIFRKLMTLTL